MESQDLCLQPWGQQSPTGLWGEVLSHLPGTAIDHCALCSLGWPLTVPHKCHVTLGRIADSVLASASLEWKGRMSKSVAPSTGRSTRAHGGCPVSAGWVAGLRTCEPALCPTPRAPGRCPSQGACDQQSFTFCWGLLCQPAEARGSVLICHCHLPVSLGPRFGACWVSGASAPGVTTPPP